MKLIITKGATSVSVNVFIRDTSVTTGAGLTGLAFNTAGLTAYYTRQNAAATAITLATQTATGAYSSGGFVAVDGTNMPGLYRLDIPDAVLATGVNSAYIMLKGATNMEPCVIEIQLAALDVQTATQPVNVTQFGGANGTFSGGRPEVNTTHAAGTAWGSGAITAASIAADAITAAKVADDVSTEFRTKALALTTASGVVGSGSTTANVVASSVAVGATTSLSADAFKGRVIIFNSDTSTAALRGQAAAIVSHTSGSTPTFTLATGAWTTAPLSGDTFTVV